MNNFKKVTGFSEPETDALQDFQENINKIPVFINEIFAAMAKELKKDHSSYCCWLKGQIEKFFHVYGFKENLKSLGIDWITLHYNTRHIMQETTEDEKWVQLGMPLAEHMEKHKAELQAYTPRLSSDSELKLSPYILFFKERVAKSGEPIKIYLCNNSEKHDNWLCVEKELVDYIKEFTFGSDAQGDLHVAQALALRCKGKYKDSVDNIVETFSDKDNRSTAKALGVFRDSCRVTLLALNRGDEKITLPRIVILMPVYIGENLVGGIAFIGSPSSKNLDTALLTSLLSALSTSLLTTLRMCEDPFRESHIRQVEELGKARANFIQRIAHSLVKPLEDHWLTVKSTMDKLEDSINTEVSLNSFKRVKEDSLKDIKRQINNLKTSMWDMMLTFSKENVDDFLVIKKHEVNIYEFIDTLIFMNNRSYGEKGIELITSTDIPKDWSFVVDKTSIMEVMTNLLTNARRYAKEKVAISVSKDDVARKFIIRVADDGPGINPTIKKDLFKPGVREVMVADKDVDSHGFGLYLSRRIMEKHNGYINYNKDLKTGAEFIIWIPFNE